MKRIMLMVVGIVLVVMCAGSAFSEDSRFVFSDKTVKDKITGLVWSRKASFGEKKYKDAFRLIKELNNKKYAGFNDWQLPSDDELNTLLAYAKSRGYNADSQIYPDKFLNNIGFKNVKNYYWTSSVDKKDTLKPWVLNFAIATFQVDDEGPYNVWPVRGRK